jgi:hypothetical protein
MAETRQAGERKRVEAYTALVEAVKVAPSNRHELIAHAVGAAVNLKGSSKNTFRLECNRVTHDRIRPIFEDALRFSEQVIAERLVRDPKKPTVQHVLLDVCQRVIKTSWRQPRQVLDALRAGYQASGSYPPD